MDKKGIAVIVVTVVVAAVAISAILMIEPVHNNKVTYHANGGKSVLD